MKYALQIYGVFRTFEVCLPQILHYIMYESLDYDVFVLTQKDDGYSIENENKIRNMLGKGLKQLKYIEHYSDLIHKQENDLFEHYKTCVSDAKKSIQNDLVTNNFVTRLWFRRYLNNLMRQEYEQTNKIHYDWVIRTRFDIGFRTVILQKELKLLLQSPENRTIYMFPDIFSCGCSSIIDYESQLIRNWPYIYRTYLHTSKLPIEFCNYKMVSKWLFMSEMNLIHYFKMSPYHTILLPNDLKIVRDPSLSQQIVRDLGNDHIAKIYYGSDNHWLEVTNQFVSQYAENYNHSTGGSVIVANNSLVNIDPIPGVVKKLVLMTIENNEFIYNEGDQPFIKYMYYKRIKYRSGQIRRVSYGTRVKIDITRRFLNWLKTHNNVAHVTNDLAGRDPNIGEEKALTILTSDGKCHIFGEYSFIHLVPH